MILNDRRQELYIYHTLMTDLNVPLNLEIRRNG